jgi:hypothetical protein
MKINRLQRDDRFVPKTPHRKARASFPLRAIVPAALPAQGAQTTKPPISGAVPACELGGVFGASGDRAADWRLGQAETGLMAGAVLGEGSRRRPLRRNCSSRVIKRSAVWL